MKGYFLVSCLAVGMLLSSCTSVQKICVQQPQKEYAGNAYKEMKGFSENEILRKMSSPTRIETDGADGKILVYEDIKTVTDATDSHTSNTRTSSYGTAQAGYNVWNGKPEVNSRNNGSSTTTHTTNSRAVTRDIKTYVNFFINSNGVCYDVVTNTGDYYNEIPGEYHCAKVYKPVDSAIMFTLIPPLTVFVGLPCTIAYLIAKKKAGQVKEWIPDEECDL